MKRKRAVLDSFIYKYRYVLAIIFLLSAALYVSVYRFWLLPAGLSDAEMTSVARSGDWSFFATMTNPDYAWSNYIAPLWSVLQATSIKLLGLSVLSVRLPAVILAVITISMIVFLAKRIFQANIAMMTGVFVVSSAFMISLARSGTYAIMATLILVLLILASHWCLRRDGLAKGRGRLLPPLLAAFLAANLAYFPGGIYAVLVLIIVAFIHPKTRYAIFADKTRTLLALLVGLTTLLPLIYALAINLLSGKWQLINQLMMFEKVSVDNPLKMAGYLFGWSPSLVNGLLAPMSTLVGTLMILVGLYHLLQSAINSIRSYWVIASLVVLLEASFVAPKASYLLFVPLIILLAISLHYIIYKWYRMFPNNPYARVFGILSMAILIGSVSLTDYGRYIGLMQHNPTIVYNYDQTLPALNSYLAKHKGDSYDLLVPKDHYHFYRLLGNSKLKVQAINNDKVASSSNKSNKVILLADNTASFEKESATKPDMNNIIYIATNGHSQKSLLFTVYEP